ncbi:XdhC/CoxI family protein [Chryseolinea sp. H1M3-3]|uniref:XdhC family protein n=1 Tax=Chryseolinea sp. H1M3-3 TaxID=3034144 RepID=UPI0023ECF2D8|nr:XdhC/CoxI family protein [Chryseolinea sp. H1M3-3]
MKDFKTIITEYRKIDITHRKAALATVVKVRGSSYRSPGARMLITDDGKWVGSISGGCLEGDALRKARQVMMDKNPMTVTYDTSEESNQNLGIGLGCNGVIDVLIEPIDISIANNAMSLFEKFVDTREPLALATIFNAASRVGEKMVVYSSGEIQNYFSDNSLSGMVEEELKQLFSNKKSYAKSFPYGTGEAEVFMELVQPTVSLIIFGGGFDARPVSQLAKNLGWNVRVTDECVAHIAPLFFPTADKLSLCHRDFIDRDFDITPFTACVLMSHNYEYDRDVLKKLIKTNTPYIGILGPRKRFDKMQQEFALQGIAIGGDDVHRIHSPIGLDIGAETPDEIAISIISEIQGKFANRSGGFLKYRKAPIHQRDSKSDQVFKQVYLGRDDEQRLASSGI